jgi:hypothetical protein
MRYLARTALVLAALAFTGCYHATIETGRPESGQRIERPWANGFVFGLVPPPTVETATTCPNGVARVETYHSVLNMLAQWITFGIYTPMTIEVTCASGGTALAPSNAIPVPSNATLEQKTAAIEAAAAIAARTGAPVFLQF